MTRPRPNLGGLEDEPWACLQETHAGVVLLLGEFAFKFKKPVRFEFLDFSTPEKRRSALERELELNRRIAPEVYLGVAELSTEEGRPPEPVLVMRRLPSYQSLESRAVRGEDLRSCLTDLAAKLAEFHASCRSSAEDSVVGNAAKPEALSRLWEENLSVWRRHSPNVLEEEVVEGCATCARDFLEGRHRLLQERIESGQVRDAHGDLLAADVFCTDSGPEVLDCIEFSDALRYCDVASEAAFLAMDLERLGRQDAARHFLIEYAKRWQGGLPPSLVDHYVAYRASVRAKVALLSFEQGKESKAEEAQELATICERHARRAIPALVLIGGLPGTGKSTLAKRVASSDELAQAMSGRPRFEVVRSDVVRKELAGLLPQASSGAGMFQGIYTSEFTDRTYQAMVSYAEELLERGRSVVLDATWSQVAHRQLAREVARRTRSRVVELCLTAPEPVLAGRLRRRSETENDVSEADETVMREIARRFEPWPEALEIDATQGVDTTIRRLRRLLGLDMGGEGLGEDEDGSERSADSKHGSKS